MKNCSKCGAAFPELKPGQSGASGYAVLPGGEKICYACSDKAQVEDLKDRSKPCGGYLDGWQAHDCGKFPPL